MSDEMEQVLERLEPRRSVAAVAPMAFMIGAIMGAILSGFATLYFTTLVGNLTLGGGNLRGLFGSGSQADADAALLSELRDAVQELNGKLGHQVDAEVPALEPRADAPLVLLPPEERTPDVLVEDIDELKRQLAAANRALKSARSDNTELRKEIAALERDLEVTERLLDAAREDAVYNRWLAFIEGAKTAICSGYTRGKREDCRRVVTDSLVTPQRRERYEYCLRSDQAEPKLEQLEPNEFPTDHGFMVNDENRLTRHWAVLSCDPSLPVDPDLSVADPPAQTTARR